MGNQKKSFVKTIYAILLALITWFALVFQLYLTTGSLVNFFSYFTILSNLLVALSLTTATFAPQTTLGKFFSKLSVQSAISLYIFVVALVYNLVLRGIVTIAGWDLILNELMHVIVPILYLIFWLVFRTEGKMTWKQGVSWLPFPFLYLVYSMVRGSFMGWYPYPFLNATKFGYPQVSLNILIMTFLFLLGALGFIGISNVLKNNTKV